MIKRQTTSDDMVKVTFALPADEVAAATSVVGTFNNWDPAKGKMVKRANGTVSATVTLEKGQKYQFRYYVAGGEWLNESDADGFVRSEHGSQNCVLSL